MKDQNIEKHINEEWGGRIRLIQEGRSNIIASAIERGIFHTVLFMDLDIHGDHTSSSFYATAKVNIRDHSPVLLDLVRSESNLDDSV